MTLTVEDGSAVSGAESYLSVVDADTYWTEHGSPTAWIDANTATKESALRYATKWLDNNYTWFSSIISTSQVLGWPRSSFYDSEGRTVGGSGVMPQALLDATAEMAYNWINESRNFTASSSNVIRERIGSSETQYSSGTGGAKSYPFVMDMLSELGIGKIKKLRRG